MNDIAIRRSEYRMAAVAIIALFTAGLIFWQWIITVRELDMLSVDVSQAAHFKKILPHNVEPPDQ